MRLGESCRPPLFIAASATLAKEILDEAGRIDAAEDELCLASRSHLRRSPDVRKPLGYGEARAQERGEGGVARG